MFLIIHIDLKCASQGQAQLQIMQDGRVELTISARSKNRVNWSSFVSTPGCRFLFFCSCNSFGSADKKLAGFYFFLDSKETCTYKNADQKTGIRSTDAVEAQADHLIFIPFGIPLLSNTIFLSQMLLKKSPALELEKDFVFNCQCLKKKKNNKVISFHFS